MQVLITSVLSTCKTEEEKTHQGPGPLYRYPSGSFHFYGALLSPSKLSVPSHQVTRVSSLDIFKDIPSENESWFKEEDQNNLSFTV